MNTLYLLIFLVIIVTFCNSFQGLYTTIGLAGAGITFALREVIVSFAGCFAILFGDFFKVGDRVLLSGIKGDVVDLGILRTTLMEIGDWVEGDQYNGRIVRVANSFIFTSPVYNYSADFPFVWDEIKLPIHFGSDVTLVRQILFEVADIIKSLWYFDESYITFSLRYIVDIRERRITKDQLFTRLLQEMDLHKDDFKLATVHWNRTNYSNWADRSLIISLTVSFKHGQESN